MIGKNDDDASHTNIPLYADGYPGIMFQQTKNDFFLLPKKKKLSELFLYGQTLDPISLDVKGAHRYVVVQLYPFASKYLLNIDPKVLNDDCYDLLQIATVTPYYEKLRASKTLDEYIALIYEVIRLLIKTHKVSENDRVEKAISIIIKSQGQLKIKELLEDIYMTERTFERNFMSYIGLTPKQFARIIQFQSSIYRLTTTTYNTLLDIGLDSGFSDQSHFIRTFKSYTGQTPSYYLTQLSRV